MNTTMDAMGSISYYEQQQQQLESTLRSLQDKVAAIEVMKADTWKLAACFFVFLMQLGFSLVEAGTVRFKNTRNIMIKNVLDSCVSAIAFWLVGYAIGFGSGSAVFGWQEAESSTLLFANVPYSVGVDFFFQFVFCATSATIFAGAVAERTQLTAYLLFNFFLAAFIYPVVAHLVWSKNGWLSAEGSTSSDILGSLGVLDNAGSLVVHVTGGVTSLVAAWIVGPRIGRFDIDGKIVPFQGHSMVFIAAGTIILWVGFYGFNGSALLYLGQSPIQWVQQVGGVCVNTTITASLAGATVWTLTYRRREPVPEDTFNGVIGGLVAACATSSVVEPYAAAVIGIIAGGCYLLGVYLTNRLRIDDPVYAIACHLFCGSWGALAVGFFATPWGIAQTYGVQQSTVTACGMFYGCGGSQLLVQLIGLLIVYAWVGTSSLVLFSALYFFDVLRVRRQEEEVGLDVAFHGGDEGDQGVGFAEAGDSLPYRRITWRQLRESMALSGSWEGGGTKHFLSAENLGFKNLGFKNWEALAAGAGRGGGTGRRQVWHRALESTQYGQFSLAMYEANYVMEDCVEVRSSKAGVFVGVHDGHNGSEAAEFVRENLHDNIIAASAKLGTGITADSIQRGFEDTEGQFASLVRQAFEQSPHVAMVGACSASVFITPSALWAANVGDCRAVLGQVRKSPEGIECRALQLTTDHNLSVPEVREQYIAEHADMPDAVICKRGHYRVKGKITVCRAFGDLYLKSLDYNRDPLASRFRVPEPFNPPLVSAEPAIAVRALQPHDAFVIVASDGLFENLTNQEAVDIVSSRPRKDIARHLIRAALQRAAQKKEVPYSEMLRMQSGQRRNFHDDITVVVHFIDHMALHRRPLGLFRKDVSVKGGASGANALLSSLAPQNVAQSRVSVISSKRTGSSFTSDQEGSEVGLLGGGVSGPADLSGTSTSSSMKDNNSESSGNRRSGGTDEGDEFIRPAIHGGNQPSAGSMHGMGNLNKMALPEDEEVNVGAFGRGGSSYADALDDDKAGLVKKFK